MSANGDHERSAETSPGPPGAGCHVISAGFGSGLDAWNVECATLDGAILHALRDASHPDQGREAVARRVLAVVRQNALPGVAIVWNGTPFPPGPQRFLLQSNVDLSVPKPWNMPFEPIDLDEADANLRAICDTDPVLQVQTCRTKRVGPFHLARWGMSYLFLVTLLPLAAIFSCCCFPSLVSAGAAGWLLAFLVFACVGYVLVRRIGTAGKWLLVPGGVVVRRERIWSRRAELRLFTPADTLLLLTPEPPGWRATLSDESRRVSRLLTRVEATALLRVWQSPCPPPPADRLADMA
jgi:hypothetical protein